MPDNLIVTLIICSCLALLLPIVYSLLKAYNSPLRSVPGPWLARYTSIWLIKAIGSREYHKINIRLHQKYGAVVRVAPNEYSIDDLEASKIIYRSRDQLVKAPWYSVWGLPNVEPSTFSTLNVEHHSRRRKQTASLYQTSAIAAIEHQVDGVTKTFLEKMAVFSRQGTTFDLALFLQFYAFDAIGVLAFGKPFGFLQKEVDIAGVLATLEGFSRYAAPIGVISEWHPVVWPFLQFLTNTKAGGLAHIYQFTDEAIAEWHQRSQDKSVNDQKIQGEEPLGTSILRSLLSKHRENPAAFSIDDVHYHTLPNVQAGGVTTGASLSATVYFLCRNPEKLRKLRSELQITGLEKAQDCLYLQAVIKESLRLFPAIGLSLPRVVPKGGLTLASHFFPEGTIVGVNSWVAHANCSIFGQDAASFQPERWLGDEATVKRMEQYFFAFGRGPRTCLGKNISLMEMTKLIPEFVLRFDISLPNPDHDWTVYNDWFVLQKDFQVRLSERKD